MGTATLAVRPTPSDFGARKVRIAIVAQNARADGFMVDDVADGVWTAGARIFAHRVHAGLLQRTIAVLSALDRQDRLGRTTGSAAAADVTARADADHRANGERWQHPALGWI